MDLGKIEESSFEGIDEIVKEVNKRINHKFEDSATIIQSYFRGWCIRQKPRWKLVGPRPPTDSPPPRRYDKCYLCGINRDEIKNRCHSEDREIDFLSIERRPAWGAAWGAAQGDGAIIELYVCQSCIVFDDMNGNDRRCTECGISQRHIDNCIFEDESIDLDSRFYATNNSEYPYQEFSCSYCYVNDNITSLESNSEISWFEGELELEENEIISDTEKSTSMKQIIRTLGDTIDDIQSKIEEGRYLKIMNLLKNLTDEINTL